MLIWLLSKKGWTRSVNFELSSTSSSSSWYISHISSAVLTKIILKCILIYLAVWREPHCRLHRFKKQLILHISMLSENPTQAWFLFWWVTSYIGVSELPLEKVNWKNVPSRWQVLNFPESVFHANFHFVRLNGLYCRRYCDDWNLGIFEEVFKFNGSTSQTHYIHQLQTPPEKGKKMFYDVDEQQWIYLLVLLRKLFSFGSSSLTLSFSYIVVSAFHLTPLGFFFFVVHDKNYSYHFELFSW